MSGRLRLRILELLQLAHSAVGYEKMIHLQSLLLNRHSLTELVRVYRSLTQRANQHGSRIGIEDEVCREAIVAATRVFYPQLLTYVTNRIKPKRPRTNRTLVNIFRKFKTLNHNSSRAVAAFRKKRWVRSASIHSSKIEQASIFARHPLKLQESIKNGKSRASEQSYRVVTYVVSWSIFDSGLNLDQVAGKYAKSLQEAIKNPRGFLRKAIEDAIWKKLSSPYRHNIYAILKWIYPKAFRHLR